MLLFLSLLLQVEPVLPCAPACPSLHAQYPRTATPEPGRQGLTHPASHKSTLPCHPAYQPYLATLQINPTATHTHPCKATHTHPY